MYGIFLSVIFILSFDQISAAEIYVSTTGNNSNTGTSWNSPKGVTFLQTLSATTVSANTTIYLKAGTYNYSAVNAISAATGFRLIGGFPAMATGTDLTGYNPLANQTNIKFSGAGTSTPYEFLNATGSVNSMLIKGIRFEGEGNLTAGGFSHVIYYGTLGSLITIDLILRMDRDGSHSGHRTTETILLPTAISMTMAQQMTEQPLIFWEEQEPHLLLMVAHLPIIKVTPVNKAEAVLWQVLQIQPLLSTAHFVVTVHPVVREVL